MLYNNNQERQEKQISTLHMIPEQKIENGYTYIHVDRLNNTVFQCEIKGHDCQQLDLCACHRLDSLIQLQNNLLYLHGGVLKQAVIRVEHLL